MSHLALRNPTMDFSADIKASMELMLRAGIISCGKRSPIDQSHSQYSAVSRGNPTEATNGMTLSPRLQNRAQSEIGFIFLANVEASYAWPGGEASTAGLGCNGHDLWNYRRGRR